MSQSIPHARILIVDDEPPQMKALCNTLSDEGYETKGFTSAIEALAVLQKEEQEGPGFDLLLTDLMMPGMDGIALLGHAKEAAPDIAGIIMTGHGTIDTAVDAMKTGALDYILKPFKLKDIIPVLSRALAMRRLRLEKADLERRVREHAEALEAANKELEAFSFSVSHDLRAPLRAIDGFSAIVIEKFGAALPPDGRRYLDNVSKNAKHMGELIDNLLNFSRTGRHPLAVQQVKLAEIARQVSDELEREWQGRDVEIRIGNLPECFGDPFLLKQAFVNLLSNAVKFTRGREKAVIEMDSREENSEKICYVRDNGVGFDMQYAGKLFGVFQRLHRPAEFEGNGVGLSIVQRIIHRHGGRIWAEAAPDQGAAFYFTLPGQPAKTNAAEQEAVKS